MEFLRLGPAGAERPALKEGNTVYDLSPLTGDIDAEFLATDGLDRARSALAAGRLAKWDDASSHRVGPPVARAPAVLCIGQNYAAHAAESGASPPSEPILFLKHPGALVGPDDAVQIPRGAVKVDWEVELAVVIGSEASYLDSPSDAAAYIAGYTVSNDVSERDFQLSDPGKQWSRGKSCPTFNPLGPSLVPADEISDVQGLRLWSTVNGEPRQESTTADMIFTVSYLVWYLSHYVALQPGDIVNTGTPEGVALSGRFPYLHAGDVLELGIEALGSQRQHIE